MHQQPVSSLTNNDLFYSSSLFKPTIKKKETSATGRNKPQKKVATPSYLQLSVQTNNNEERNVSNREK